MRIILLFLATLLFANEKLIISKFTNLKPYYYNNQIVNLKLKTIVAEDGKLFVKDDMNHSYDSLLKGDEYISYIQFQLKDKFPKFNVSLENNGSILDELNISINSKIKTLYPPKDFCGVLADDIKINEKILASYDDTHNIVYWTITAFNGNLKDFKLNFNTERLYFLDSNQSMMSYSFSALVPLTKKDFKFSYFNLKENRYKTIKFHIDLENETVSTQTDIRPMAKSNLYIINILLGILLILWIVLYLYRKKIVYIVLIIIVIVVIVFLNLPKKEIFLHKGVKVKVLPFENSTTFIIVPNDIKVEVLTTKDGYKKIEINKKIGWVKDE